MESPKELRDYLLLVSPDRTDRVWCTFRAASEHGRPSILTWKHNSNTVMGSVDVSIRCFSVQRASEQTVQLSLTPMAGFMTPSASQGITLLASEDQALAWIPALQSCCGRFQLSKPDPSSAECAGMASPLTPSEALLASLHPVAAPSCDSHLALQLHNQPKDAAPWTPRTTMLAPPTESRPGHVSPSKRKKRSCEGSRKGSRKGSGKAGRKKSGRKGSRSEKAEGDEKPRRRKGSGLLRLRRRGDSPQSPDVGAEKVAPSPTPLSLDLGAMSGDHEAGAPQLHDTSSTESVASMRTQAGLEATDDASSSLSGGYSSSSRQTQSHSAGNATDGSQRTIRSEGAWTDAWTELEDDNDSSSSGSGREKSTNGKHADAEASGGIARLLNMAQSLPSVHPTESTSDMGEGARMVHDALKRKGREQCGSEQGGQERGSKTNHGANASSSHDEGTTTSDVHDAWASLESNSLESSSVDEGEDVLLTEDDSSGDPSRKGFAMNSDGALPQPPNKALESSLWTMRQGPVKEFETATGQRMQFVYHQDEDGQLRLTVESLPPSNGTSTTDPATVAASFALTASSALMAHKPRHTSVPSAPLSTRSNDTVSFGAKQMSKVEKRLAKFVRRRSQASAHARWGNSLPKRKKGSGRLSRIPIQDPIYLLYDNVDYLCGLIECIGGDTIGLYRVKTKDPKVPKLWASIVLGEFAYLQTERDSPMLLADTLMMYVRELTTPLIPLGQQSPFLAASRGLAALGAAAGEGSPEYAAIVGRLRDMVMALHETHGLTLSRLVRHIGLLAAQHHVTRMDVSQLCSVWAPIVAVDDRWGSDPTQPVNKAKAVLLTQFVQHYGFIFSSFNPPDPLMLRSTDPEYARMVQAKWEEEAALSERGARRNAKMLERQVNRLERSREKTLPKLTQLPQQGAGTVTRGTGKAGTWSSRDRSHMRTSMSFSEPSFTLKQRSRGNVSSAVGPTSSSSSPKPQRQPKRVDPKASHVRLARSAGGSPLPVTRSPLARDKSHNQDVHLSSTTESGKVLALGFISDPRGVMVPLLSVPGAEAAPQESVRHGRVLMVYFDDLDSDESFATWLWLTSSGVFFRTLLSPPSNVKPVRNGPFLYRGDALVAWGLLGIIDAVVHLYPQAQCAWPQGIDHGRARSITYQMVAVFGRMGDLAAVDWKRFQCQWEGTLGQQAFLFGTEPLVTDFVALPLVRFLLRKGFVRTNPTCRAWMERLTTLPAVAAWVRAGGSNVLRPAVQAAPQAPSPVVSSLPLVAPSMDPTESSEATDSVWNSEGISSSVSTSSSSSSVVTSSTVSNFSLVTPRARPGQRRRRRRRRKVSRRRVGKQSTVADTNGQQDCESDGNTPIAGGSSSESDSDEEGGGGGCGDATPTLDDDDSDDELGSLAWSGHSSGPKLGSSTALLDFT